MERLKVSFRGDRDVAEPIFMEVAQFNSEFPATIWVVEGGITMMNVYNLTDYGAQEIMEGIARRFAHTEGDYDLYAFYAKDSTIYAYDLKNKSGFGPDAVYDFSFRSGARRVMVFDDHVVKEKVYLQLTEDFVMYAMQTVMKEKRLPTLEEASRWLQQHTDRLVFTTYVPWEVWA